MEIVLLPYVNRAAGEHVVAVLREEEPAGAAVGFTVGDEKYIRADGAQAAVGGVIDHGEAVDAGDAQAHDRGAAAVEVDYVDAAHGQHVLSQLLQRRADAEAGAAVEDVVDDGAVALDAYRRAGVGVGYFAVPAVPVVYLAVEREDVAAAGDPVGVLETAVGAAYLQGDAVADLEALGHHAQSRRVGGGEDEVVPADAHAAAVGVDFGDDQLDLAAERQLVAAQHLKAHEPAVAGRAGGDGGEVFAEHIGAVVGAGLVQVLGGVLVAVFLVCERQLNLRLLADKGARSQLGKPGGERSGV